jgi:cob(I)alamin adenosyltransferase
MGTNTEIKNKLIDKWERDVKVHENFAFQCKEEKFALMHEARIDQLKQCIKDYEKFINLKK